MHTITHTHTHQYKHTHVCVRTIDTFGYTQNCSCTSAHNHTHTHTHMHVYTYSPWRRTWTCSVAATPHVHAKQSARRRSSRPGSSSSSSRRQQPREALPTLSCKVLVPPPPPPLPPLPPQTPAPTHTSPSFKTPTKQQQQQQESALLPPRPLLCTQTWTCSRIRACLPPMPCSSPHPYPPVVLPPQHNSDQVGSCCVSRH